MQKIVVKEIPGGLKDFLECMEDKSKSPEYRGKLQVAPDVIFDENKLGQGAKLAGVILSGVGVVVPVIKYWIDGRKNKTKKDQNVDKFFLNLTYSDKEGNELKIISLNMTLEQIAKTLKNLESNRRFELEPDIKKVKRPQDQMNSVKKILILSANPKVTHWLRLDEEVREIEEGLRRAKHRGQFVIQSRLAVRLRDLRRALLDFEPHIVHFTGHGKKDGLIAEDELGFNVRISSKALTGLFELFSDQVGCVVLNACYSEKQAAAIKKHINYVIGMRKEINDKAAIEFAVGFYDALGAGKSVEEAFKFGRNAVQQKFPDLSGHLIPVLKRRKV